MYALCDMQFRVAPVSRLMCCVFKPSLPAAIFATMVGMDMDHVLTTGPDCFFPCAIEAADRAMLTTLPTGADDAVG